MVGTKCWSCRQQDLKFVRKDKVFWFFLTHEIKLHSPFVLVLWFAGMCSYKNKYYKPGDSFRRGCDKCYCHNFGSYCFTWVADIIHFKLYNKVSFGVCAVMVTGSHRVSFLLCDPGRVSPLSAGPWNPLPGPGSVSGLGLSVVTRSSMKEILFWHAQHIAG